VCRRPADGSADLELARPQVLAEQRSAKKHIAKQWVTSPFA
jgi:hypothetical protein